MRCTPRTQAITFRTHGMPRHVQTEQAASRCRCNAVCRYTENAEERQENSNRTCGEVAKNYPDRLTLRLSLGRLDRYGELYHVLRAISCSLRLTSTAPSCPPPGRHRTRQQGLQRRRLHQANQAAVLIITTVKNTQTHIESEAHRSPWSQWQPRKWVPILHSRCPILDVRNSMVNARIGDTRAPG